MPWRCVGMLIFREILTGVGTCICDEGFIWISWKNYIGVFYVDMSTMFELQNYLLLVRKCKGYILAFLGVVYIFFWNSWKEMLCVFWNNCVNSGMPVIVDILMFNFCRPLPFVFIPLIAIRKWNDVWKQIIRYHCVVSFLGSTHPFLFSERNLLNTL